jgi:DNA-binding NtrC family response regulator
MTHARRRSRILHLRGRVNPALRSLLVARFVELPAGRALDLSTGRHVVIIRRRLDPVARAVWPTVLDRLASLWHPGIAPCVDFGFTPAGEWFEAYDVDSGERDQAATATHFLAAHAVDCSLVRPDAGRKAAPLIPAFPDAAERTRATARRSRGLGMRLLPRTLEDLIGRAIAEGRLGGPLVWGIDAPPGSGWRTTWRRLARVARLSGYVPIDHTLLDLPGPPQRGSWLGALAGTSLVIAVEQVSWQPARRRQLAQLLVRLGSLPSLSVIVLDVLRGGRPEAARYRLGALEAAALASALWVPPGCSPHWLRARRVAEATGGLPGPFLDAVARRLGLRASSTTVHERPDGPRASAEPAREASAALRRAAALVGRGRAAAADRFLAKTMGEMGRRATFDGTGMLMAARAELLASRGDVDGSRSLWEQATGANADVTGLAEAACRIAAQWIRCGALDQAESMLTAAAAARHVAGEARSATHAVLLMYVRCWQTRWREALNVECCDEARAGLVWPALEVGDIDSAAEHLRVARTVRQSLDARWVETARLRLDIALGAQDRLWDAASIAPASARDLPDDDLRLLPIEGLTRLGVPLSPSMRRLLRGYLRPRSPRLGRARARLALAVDSSRDGRSALLVDDVARAVRATRACALSSGASRISCWRREPPEAAPMLNELMAVLRACQAHDDPRVAMAHAVRLVGERLQADGAAATGRGGSSDITLASVGGFDLAAVSRRAMEVGGPVAETLDGASDVAVPVRLGEQVAGAVAVRWAMPSGGPSAQAIAWLEAVATAVAPTVRLAVELAPPAAKPCTDSALVGVSEAIARVRTAVETAARAPFRVLIEGESGSGKELVAREIHRLGPRRSRAFCAINCAALTDDLCEAELFGHARGAYTGAISERAGLFEEADGGTLFLDEVGELSPRAQAKLLRALQEGEIRRLGETRPRRVDVRLIAATNRPLADAVEAGIFRADLRYRLDVIHITVPPLRQRADDVPLLAEQFWKRAVEGVGSRAQLSVEAVAALARYDWPGNVRELQNVLSAVAAEAPARGVVRAAALPAGIGTREPPAAVTLEQARRMSDERAVRDALAQAGGHRGRAASALGLTRQGLAKLVDRLQLDAARSVTRPS